MIGRFEKSESLNEVIAFQDHGRSEELWRNSHEEWTTVAVKSHLLASRAPLVFIDLKCAGDGVAKGTGLWRLTILQYT